MESVWQVLGKRKLLPRPVVFFLDADGEAVWRPIAPSAYTLKEAVIELVVSLVTHRIDVTKYTELEEACRRYRRSADDLDCIVEELRAAALADRQLRGPGPSGLRNRADRLADAAITCRELAEMRPLLKPEPLMIDRDHGERDVRAFCILLARQFEQVFGEQLQGQIAVIASVVFGRVIPGYRVRDWLL
jgi:hypothetical protein